MTSTKRNQRKKKNNPERTRTKTKNTEEAPELVPVKKKNSEPKNTHGQVNRKLGHCHIVGPHVKPSDRLGVVAAACKTDLGRNSALAMQRQTKSAEEEKAAVGRRAGNIKHHTTTELNRTTELWDRKGRHKS
jgi:hypothetical protein